MPGQKKSMCVPHTCNDSNIICWLFRKFRFIGFNIVSCNKDRISSDKTLKVATCYSENFSFFTVRQIHKKDHSNEYFNFLDGFRNHEIPLGKIKTPRYTAGQQIHCFRINKITTALLMKPIDFSSWNAYDYPEDLAFYKNCIPWFRCISHEKMVLVNETNLSAFNELKKIGINFRLINNSNYI